MDIPKLKQKLKRSRFGLHAWYMARGVFHFFNYHILPDKYVVVRDYKRIFGYKPDLDAPRKLNEKLQWMKLYDRERWHSFFADKFYAREFFSSKFGDEYLVPLLFETTNVKEVRPENIPSFPCIIKSNHAMAQWKIVRRPEDIDWKTLRQECRYWLSENWYDYSKEYQYKFIKPRILVEKLLETKNGTIPNDYKLHFINGEIAFIYVSFDREGKNDRVIYDKDWNKLPFSWVPKDTYFKGMGSSDVPRPERLDDMISMGTEIAKIFPRYIRVDFYEVDGKLYFGEVTFHHGGGWDTFFPEKYNDYYGHLLRL